MPDIPPEAPRSEDGQWWWDGREWKHVADAGVGDAPIASSGGAESSSARSTTTTTGGQLSEDGQWQWDGAQWQPAHGATQQALGGASTGQAAGTTAATTHDAAPSITIAEPTLALATMTDGTTGLNVRFSITNTGTSSIEAGMLTPLVVAVSTDSAESNAHAKGLPAGAFAIGDVYEGTIPIQLDPGTWTVTVAVRSKTGAIAGTSPESSIRIPGHGAAHLSFDDKQSYSLSVKIQQVEHLGSNLFRVHYLLENTSDRELPAGMQVHGEIGGGASDQWYQLQSAVPARQSHASYLTLEAAYPSTVTAMITADPSGPSAAADAVLVNIADDGTPTISPQ